MPLSLPLPLRNLFLTKTADYYIKPLERIGCDVHNTMVIDLSENNFYYNKDIGLELPWNAQRKDSKLVDLLDFLHPAFVSEVKIATISK